MPWYVSYDDATHALNREGPDPHPAEKGYTVVTLPAAPVQFDAFTMQRVRAWDPVSMTYAPLDAGPGKVPAAWDGKTDRRAKAVP